MRRFSDAATAGVKRALGAGARAPLVQVLGAMPGSSQEEAQLAGLLGALAAVYVPLEIRLNINLLNRIFIYSFIMTTSGTWAERR